MEGVSNILFYCYLICQFGTGGRTQKPRPVEVLTHSQKNLKAKEQPRTTYIDLYDSLATPALFIDK